MTAKKMLPVPIVSCPDCWVAYDADELERLEATSEDGADLMTWACPCGGELKTTPKVYTALRHAVVDPDRYAELRPDGEDRSARAVWVAPSGRRLPPLLGPLLAGERNTTLLVLVIILAGLLGYGDELRNFLVENW